MLKLHAGSRPSNLGASNIISESEVFEALQEPTPEDYIRIYGAANDLQDPHFIEMAKNAARDLELEGPDHVDALFALGVAMVELGKEGMDFEPLNYGIKNLDKAKKLSHDVVANKI